MAPIWKNMVEAGKTQVSNQVRLEVLQLLHCMADSVLRWRQRPGEDRQRHHQPGGAPTSTFHPVGSCPHPLHQDRPQVRQNSQRAQVPDEAGGHQAALQPGDQRARVQHWGPGQAGSSAGLVHEIQVCPVPAHEWQCLLNLYLLFI